MSRPSHVDVAPTGLPIQPYLGAPGPSRNEGRAARPAAPRITISSFARSWFRNAQLTPQEAAVAGMAAQGCSDRDIAAELFISCLVVRSHLARVCAKLDIRSPALLVRAVADLGGAPQSATAASDECRPSAPDAPASPGPQAVEVARLVRQGWSERAIAAELFTSVATVRAHISRLYAEPPDRAASAPPV